MMSISPPLSIVLGIVKLIIKKGGAVQVPDVYRKFGFDDSIDLVVFVVAVS